MIVGKPINKGALVGMDQKEWYIGHEARAKAQFLQMYEPVIGGQIQDMAKMEQVFTYLINEVM